MAEPSMFNSYDVATAQNQNANTNAMNVAQLPAGRATVYGAGVAGNMLSSGVNQALGRVTPQQQKAEIVSGIMKKYVNADPTNPQNILMMARDFADNNLPGLANKFMSQYQTAIEPKPAPTDTPDIKNFNKAVIEGFPGSFYEYQKSLKSGNKQVSIGSVPQDFIIVTNELGEITMEVIPGSPTDIKAKKDQAGKDEGAVVRNVQKSIVVEDIDRLKTKIIEAPWYNPVAGSILAKFMENPYIGAGKNRIDGLALATTIKSSIGFDRLQQMRDESPTGGALGQVSELELITLQATLGSLDLDQSEEQLLANLDRLGIVYAAMLLKIAETGDGTFEEKMGGSASTTAAGSGTTNLDPFEIRKL